jgi:hypothetical protein
MALQTAIVLHISFRSHMRQEWDVQEPNRPCSEDGDIIRSCDLAILQTALTATERGSIYSVRLRQVQDRIRLQERLHLGIDSEGQYIQYQK